MSFNEIVDVLNRQGHNFSFTQVPADVFATLFPGAAEIARDVQVLRSAYLLGFGVTRPNCVRKQNSRQTTNEVFDVGSTECPGPEPLNATIHSMRIEIMETLLDHVFITVKDLDRSIAFYETALKPLGIVHALDYDGKNGPMRASRPQGHRTGRSRIRLPQAWRCGRPGCAYRPERVRGERVLRGSNGAARDRPRH